MKLSSGNSEKLVPLSVIVAMKNEEKNVRRCLNALVAQHYPRKALEIIIVDDASTDNTPDILREYQQKHPFVAIIRNNDDDAFRSGKKTALSKAIEQSRGKLLLFTDADCVPSPNWAKTMASCFDEDVGMVVGFSPVIDLSDSLFGKILRLDSLSAGIVAAGSLGAGSAVTCTGRNMAYRRQAYEQVGGFSEINHSVSGDDDLFLQLLSEKTDWKIKFATDKESIVPAYQTVTPRQFFRQKRRHLSAGKYYRPGVQLSYFLFHLSNLGFFLFLLLALIYNKYIAIAAGLLILKLLADWWLLKTGSKKFNMPIQPTTFLLWEVFFLSYHLTIGPASWIGKIKWK